MSKLIFEDLPAKFQVNRKKHPKFFKSALGITTLGAVGGLAVRNAWEQEDGPLHPCKLCPIFLGIIAAWLMSTLED